ncbi:ubinuclein-1 [Beta vulgaris subsp. vulgaris]|uniref:ubinuclein-1 n=1 Tax=Beta vulgaris subsp. vulgaris TaxID=3555 RepID=UPI00203684DE|nr:ubinuclein-1 [Beta vulgaris subsp. vulgaris]
MAAKEEKGDACLSTQRQRFYVELKPGETTIVSWKKLLRKAKEKDQCPLISSSVTKVKGFSSCGPTSSSSPLDDNYDGGQYHDSVIRNKRVKHVNRATPSGYMQPSKRRGTKIEGEKNDSHSSIKPGGQHNKDRNLLNETFRHSSLPAMVKDDRSEKLQKITVDPHSPVLAYSKKSSSRSKSRCPPLNAVEDAPVFPLITMDAHSPLITMPDILQSTQNITYKNIKVGVEGDTSAAMHQNIEGRSLPVKASSTSTSEVLSHNKVSSKSRHSDKSYGSRENVDTMSLGHKSSLKDSVPNVVKIIQRNPDQIPCAKRKFIHSSNNCNPIPSLPSKKTPKKAAIEQKPKQLVLEKPIVKVRFLLKQEHETLKSNEQPAKHTLNQPRYAAPQTCSANN